MLTSYSRLIIILILLAFLGTSNLFAKNEQKVETASKIDVRLPQENKSLSNNEVSWASRYSSLLTSFQKLEIKLLAYRTFLANWDIVVDSETQKGRRDLFEEIERIKLKLQASLAQLDKARLEIVLNQSLSEVEKEKLARPIIKAKEQLQKIYFVPSQKSEYQGKILDVNSKLNAVIINLGIKNSVFEGSSWVVKNDKKEIVAQLQVFMVKRDIALAQVIKGDIKLLKKDTLIERKIKK